MTFIWLAYLYWLNNGVPAGSENMDAGLVWWLLVLIPGVVCSVFLLIQRVHDIGISGWWLLPIWIAVAVIGCVIPLWIPSTIGTLAIGFGRRRPKITSSDRIRTRMERLSTGCRTTGSPTLPKPPPDPLHCLRDPVFQAFFLFGLRS